MSSSSADEDRKKQLYSRQEYVVGAEAQRKYGSTSVLVVGTTGPAAEIIKNLALTGVKALFILDNDRVTLQDLGSNFFVKERDVGQLRSQTVANAAAELNRFVHITAVSGDLTSLIPKVNVVVFVNHCTCTLADANALARQHQVKFVACESRGVTGSVFVDGGENFTVVDRDGEDLNTCIVTSMTPDGIVSLHEERKHECEAGSEVYFTGLASPKHLNSTILSPAEVAHLSVAEAEAATKLQCFEVEEVMTPFVLRLRSLPKALKGQTIEVGTAAYLHTTKKKEIVQFKPLAQSINEPDFCMIFDKDEKMNAPEELHAIYRAVSEAEKIPTSVEEATAIASAAKKFCGSLNEQFAVEVLTVFAGDLNPMACLIGGIASQEALKLCSGKFTPVQQWLYFDSRELLQARENGSDPRMWRLSPLATSSRYQGQMTVLGEGFQDFLALQRAFIVGAGALGCELIKNAALVGLGGVSITDMDTVEMSNLSRQFLFRDHHIGKAKSTVAAQSAQSINPKLQISSYELKVGSETEGTFSETFWMRHSVVLNALDNVTSRQYVDERCLFYKRPLFESGTLGTKCNVQCVIPYVTESYSQSFDPPEKSIPLCTLKNFPNTIEHTIQWSRDQFHLLFHNTPDDVNQYLLNFQGFAAAMIRDPAAAGTALRNVDTALRTWPMDAADCIRKARLLFHEYFNENFRQLLHNIPLNKRNDDGSMFWSGAKKPPTPLEFRKDRADDVDFIYHTACLLAKVYNLPNVKVTREQAAEVAAQIDVPPFIPKVALFATSEKDKQPSSPTNTGEVDIKDLPPVLKFPSKRMSPENFEKDDLSNHHMQFITSCSNLRATAYGIPVADLAKTKKIAGSIIPAMVTTTSLVTGLVALEALKYLLLQYQSYQKGQLVPPPPTPAEVAAQLSLYRNSFVNIAIPFIAFSDPIMAQGRTYKLPSGKVIRWSAWDRIDVDEGRDITVKELVAVLEQRFEMEVSMISLTSGKMIFMQFGGKAKDKALPVSELAQQRGEALKPGCDFMDLIVTGSIEEEDVDMPVVRYRFRHF